MLRLLLCFLIPLIISQPIEAKNYLTFATMDKFAPYSWMENDELTGIDIDLIQELERRLKIPIKIEIYPWRRVVRNTELGHIDGCFSLFKTPDREEFAIYTKTPIHVSLYKAFVRTGSSFVFRKISDLKGIVLGKNKGFRISKEFDRAEQDKNLNIFEGEMTHLIKLLMRQRIDAIIGNYDELNYLTNKLKLVDRIVALEKPIRNPRPAYLVISKKAIISKKDNLIKRINQSLKSMKEDGTINKITSKYVSSTIL